MRKLLLLLNKMFPNQKYLENIEIGKVSVDSRNIKKNDIFIGIRGGNEYIQDVLKKGVCLAFYDDKNIIIEDKSMG